MVPKSDENRDHAIASSAAQEKGEAEIPVPQSRCQVKQEPWKTAQTDGGMMKKT